MHPHRRAPTRHPIRSLAAGLLAAACLAPLAARGTPSTNFWAPSTPNLQGFGVLHLTYDNYFNASVAYASDLGLTIGVLPFKGLQAEVGFDLFYPTVVSGSGVALPVVLNAKVGTPEDTLFSGQPGWSLGIFGVGFEKEVNDQDVLYLMIGKTFPDVGQLSAGGYYGLNEKLFRSASGEKQQAGALLGWASPAIDVPVVEKLQLTWDLQTGRNVLGATGGGAYVYFTPAVSLETGPVFFFDEALQPGGASWLWSVQLDVDVDFLSGGASPAPAPAQPAPPKPATPAGS